MDFMKVLDQTVREIKREVNLRVLKVPEIEQKVLDATNDEPWGPHGSALAEISQATKKFTECQMIMNVLWTRLTDTGANWRHVYKALAVMEYLVANGSDRAVDDILEHSFRISSLSGFEYVEPNGKDVGINVRKKVETILALLNDKEKIQAVRNKAAANRDKYFGLSSTGITYKSGSSSYGGSSFQHNDGYGGRSGAKEVETFKSGYKERDQNGGDEFHGNRDRRGVLKKSQERRASVNERTNQKKGTTHLRRDSLRSSGTKSSAKHDHLSPPKSSNAQTNDNDCDDFDPRGSCTSEFDDFDPRGSSTSESVATSFKQMDLFGDSLISDLMDAPTSSAEVVNCPAHEVDLFANATFVSAPHAETSTGSCMQGQIDLFADQPTVHVSSPNIDLFSKPDSGTSTETKSPMSTDKGAFDPFAAVLLNTPEGSNLLGDFTSHLSSATLEPSQNSGKDITSEGSNLFGDVTSHQDSASLEPSQNSGSDSLGNLNQSTSMSSKPVPMKDTFRVKSGIWADSLSRGLVDLNLTAPKKVSLSEIGIVGGLTDGSDEKEKRPPASAYMGRAMGTGTGLGKPGFLSSSSTGWK